jgi:hypothetical protein
MIAFASYRLPPVWEIVLVNIVIGYPFIVCRLRNPGNRFSWHSSILRYAMVPVFNRIAAKFSSINSMCCFDQDQISLRGGGVNGRSR